VVFERPRDEAFVRKWQLACQGDVAHVVVMPNVGVDKITSFVEDLAAKRRIWYQHGEGLVGLCVAKDIGRENCLCGLHDKGANFPSDSPHDVLADESNVPVHLAYNPSYSACFFSQNNIFLSQKNQPTVFFSRLIIPAERLQCYFKHFSYISDA
jgi:hypothetical protein